MTTNPQYRPCVGIALFNKQGKVFVGERIDTPGAWQMPQGGMDPNENIEETARRELFEETGISNAVFIKLANKKLRYDLPDTLAQKLWNGRYKGQEQSWVAMLFEGNEEDINLNTHEPAEFSAWQWVSLDKAIDLIVPFKRQTYQEVITLFADIPQSISRD